MKRRRWKETVLLLGAANIVVIEDGTDVWLVLRGTKQPRPLVIKKPRRKA